ncbi:depolymerase [Geosmithia morbida]|uniref:feruloyl esterase n=1 Tax=Geosmithia morbida TaxID=1094350 RepID=A0A9P4Z3N0_9HYPO|nr:depolymerase [Geosmithia morbida]KAF4126926.1 depolymerase [Geosmithia morbida]
MHHRAPILSVLAVVATAAAAAAAAAAEPYTGGDASGCGKKHYFDGLPHYHAISSGGTTRRYSVHLPSTYEEDRAYPAILGFHGSSSIGLFFEADTRLSSARFTPDTITVYPDGLGGAWAGANYSDATTTQDLDFVLDLLSDLRREYCVDSARIYATGMSIGGGFVDTIACSERVGREFAAFAPASGSFYTDNDDSYRDCRPARVPTPVLEIHGGADEEVPYDGGPGSGGRLPSIPQWASRWAGRNLCEHETESDLFDGHVRRLSWSCQGHEGAVQHYRTDDQKHCWASTEPNFSQVAAGDGPTYLEASELIAEFFRNFTRPS